LFLMLAIFPTIAHVIFNSLLDAVSPTTISMSMLLEPVGASLLAYMLLSETLDALQLIGGVIVLIGVYFFLMAQRKNNYIK